MKLGTVDADGTARVASFDATMWDPQFPALARQYRAIRYDLRGFGESGVPVAGRDHVADLLALILGGALDVAGYREIGAVLMREIPNAERRELAGCGHLVNLERPAEFTGLLLGFLACHP